MDTHMAPVSIEYIPLGAIQPSPTNPRKRFDQESLKELAVSIKEQGILEPILLRPVPPEIRNGQGIKYEIVAGERRWRAGKIAGIAHAPAIIRNLPDVQVLEIQITENLQRKDLDPMEEAEGYKRLMELKKINADQLGELLGKSRAYVYTRTKLNDLCPEGRKFMQDGKLDASRALLIARIGHHDTQRQALKDALNSRYSRRPMSYRELQEHIRENYMLRLKDAPFDINDVKLCPKAGSCQACPKRSGNQQDLFGDVKNADVCTDPKCFDDKRQAHFAVSRKQIEAEGNKVIYGDAAKKILRDWEDPHYDDRLEGGYVALNSTTWMSGRSRKVGEILSEDYKAVLIQHPRTGKIIKAATQQAVSAAANKAGKTVTGGGMGAYHSPRPAKSKGPDIDEVEMERLVALIHKNAPKTFGKDYMHAFAEEIVSSYGPVRNGHAAIAKAWGWQGKPFGGGYYARSLPKEARKLNDRDLLLFLMEVIFVSQYQRDDWLKLFGIKEQDVRDQIIKERREAAAAERAAAKAKKEAKKKPAAPQAKKADQTKPLKQAKAPSTKIHAVKKKAKKK